MKLTVIGYKNHHSPRCPSLENVLFHLALNGLKATCTVTKYSKVDTGTADFELEAQEAIIVVETPDDRSNEMVEYVKKQVNLD